MEFNSFVFVGFFLLVFLLYSLLAHRGQNLLLLVASYVFYGYWDPRFLNLILFSTAIDFIAGKKIQEASDRRTRRLWLLVSLVTNLGLLGVFKYFNFFIENAQSLLVALGGSVNWHSLKIILPMGISFYTFQTMSYTIDIYRGKLKPAASFLDFALYVSYFPQLVAGPIERASHLLPQIEKKRTVRYEQVREGCWLILLGYFMKTVVADNLAPFVNEVFDHPGQAHGSMILVAIVAFAFQIYGDFGGYSNIARGISYLFGVDLMVNFRMPYFASNPSEFWQRWHISLSTWLRDYLYIPLGGNRKGSWCTIRNLLLTMLLGGLWHGAAWHFVAWGAFHGLLLVVYHLLGRTKEESRWNLSRLFRAFLFFVLGLFGWVLFRVNHLADIPVLFHNLMHGFEWSGKVGLVTLFCFAGPLMIIDALQERAGSGCAIKKCPVFVRLGVYAFLFVLILLAGSKNNYAFIYFKF